MADGTNESLLRRVRDPNDQDSWREFFELYAPLIRFRAKRWGMMSVDADEVTQECMRVLHRRMAGFRYDRARGRFKGYICRIADNAIRRKLKTQQRDRQVEVTSSLFRRLPAKEEEAWQSEWLQRHFDFLLERAASKFSERTLEAFRAVAIANQSAASVATKLGISKNQVYLSKHRVIRWMRENQSRLIGDVDEI